MNEIKPRTITDGELREYPLCGGPACPSFSCQDKNEYIDARCKKIGEPIPRWRYYPCAPYLLHHQDELRAEMERLRAKVAAMQLVIDGFHNRDAEKFCAGVNAAIDIEKTQTVALPCGETCEMPKSALWVEE